MLSFEVTDINGRKTTFASPLSVSIVSSEDAPADSLSAVFAVSGSVPVLKSISAKMQGETVFLGEIDRQDEVISGRSHRLELKARSIAAVLLDNEARPQQYFMPSMPLLMERHFAPLGFTRFIGTDKAFNGELIISKGMSEWAVLQEFCDKFLRTKPKIGFDGVIDISGSDPKAELFIGDTYSVLYKKKTFRRSAVISEIFARTHNGGGYDMHLESDNAERLGIRRRRFVSSINSKSRSLLDTEKIIPRAERSAVGCETEIAGSIPCIVGDRLRLEGDNKTYRITERHYTYSSEGEKTRIYSEVDEDVAW